MTEELTRCSFCDKPATCCVADPHSYFDSCAACAAAWALNPGFGDKTMPENTIKLELCSGVAGVAVYLDDTRIAGATDNGIMTVTRSWDVRREDLLAALAPSRAT